MKSAGRRIFLGGLMVMMLWVSNCSNKPPLVPRMPGVREAESMSLRDLAGKRKDQEDIKPMPPERQEALGDLLLSKKEYETSLASYLQILKEHPDRHDVRYKVGVALLLSGQYEGARSMLGLVLAAQPNNLDAREALGLTYMQEKQYPKAIEEFRTVLSQDPGRAKSQHLLGVTHLMAEKPREALRELEKAAQLNPRNASTYAGLAQANLELKNYPKALDWARKGLGVDPENKRLIQQSGLALASLKRYDEAFQAFAKGGDEAQAYNNIGVHYFMDGRYEEAAKCFQKALDLRPTHYHEAKANLNKALEKLQEGHKDRD